MTLEVRLATVNAWDLPPARFREDVDEVAGLRPDVVLWQEVETAEEHGGVDRAFDPARFAHLFSDTPTPITVDGELLEVVDTGRLVTHKGRAGVTPARRFVWALVDPVEDPAPPWLIVNTHMVSGAWNRKPKRDKMWRRRVWTEHAEQLAQHLDAWSGHGFSVMLGGDFNRVNVPELHRDLRWLTGDTIDKLGILTVPGGAVLERGSVTRRRNLYSDHHARYVDVRVRAPR